MTQEGKGGWLASPTSAIPRVFRSGNYANVTGCQLVAMPGLPWLTAGCRGSLDPVSPASPTVIVALARPGMLLVPPVNRGALPLLKDHDTYVGTHEYLYWARSIGGDCSFPPLTGMWVWPAYCPAGLARLPSRKEAVSGREWETAHRGIKRLLDRSVHIERPASGARRSRPPGRAIMGCGSG
jgi:hypothetical protein